MRMTVGNYTRFKSRVIKGDEGENGEPKTVIIEDHTPDVHHPIELDVRPPANGRMAKRYSVVFSGLHYLEFRRNWWIDHIGVHLRKIKSETVLEDVLTIASKVESEMNEMKKRENTAK